MKLIIPEARLLITDACTYSCSWCAINQYKQWIPIDGSGFNEWALVQSYKNTINRLLNPEDYWFLAKILHEEFWTQDFTLTWWEAFLRREYEEITKNIKNNSHSKITTLTKWAPLYELLKRKAKSLQYTDRIIFSIDTLDNREHANIHLPLMNREKAKNFLEKTIWAIEKSREMNKEISLNTILLPDAEKSLSLFEEIIDFSQKNNIWDIKFLELDTDDIHEPYIEDLMEYILQNSNSPHLKNVIFFPIQKYPKKQKLLEIPNQNGNIIKISIYRWTCSQEHKFNHNLTSSKECEIWQNGSLTINTTGEIIPCTGNPKKKISLFEEVKKQDTKQTILWIQKWINEIVKQKCPIFFKSL